MSSALRVDVAGAGVVGLATAICLAGRGAQVRVFDPATLGQNASGVAAGMLAPASETLTDPAAAPHLPLLLAARDAWPAFAEASGLNLDRSGAVLLGDAARLAAFEDRADRLGLTLAPRTRSQLPELPGGYDGSTDGGLFTADDWRIDAEALAQMARRARDLGVVIQAEAFAPDDADHVVLAGGLSPGLRRFAPELALLTPIRGHILACRQQAYAGPVLRGPGAYVAPAAKGLLVGATMEPGEGDATVSPAIAKSLATQAGRTFPGLSDWSWRAQAGVRAATPDGLPLVGFSADGAVVAAGARRNGWLLAPLVGQMVADLLTGRDPGPWAQRLAPDRFAR